MDLTVDNVEIVEIEDISKKRKLDLLNKFLENDDEMLNYIIKKYPKIQKEIDRIKKYSFTSFSGHLLQYILSFCFDNPKEAAILMSVSKVWYDASRYKTFWRRYVSYGIDGIHNKSLRESIDPFHAMWWGSEEKVESAKHLKQTVRKQFSYFNRYPEANKQDYFIHYDLFAKNRMVYYTRDLEVYGEFDTDFKLHERYPECGKDITYISRKDRLFIKGNIDNRTFIGDIDLKTFDSFGHYVGKGIEINDNKVVKNGQGKYEWKNGDYYEGEFSCDFATNSGKFYHAASNKIIETNLIDVGIEVSEKKFYETILSLSLSKLGDIIHPSSTEVV